MELYFSDYFGVPSRVVEGYGAFDISIASDLPLFIDPFLLFNSEKSEYKELHEGMLKYLRFLRDKAATGTLDEGLIASWYRFKEVKQNWLGFTVLGNGGHALGSKFANALHESLGSIFADFGNERVTKASHLEKLCLMRAGVGRDSISDFTTSLIKYYILEYTQEFSRQHLRADQCKNFSITRVRFNYETESWATGTFYLPSLRGDFVLLTPADILTRDDTWISSGDLLHRFSQLPDALPNPELRAQVNNYFAQHLKANPTQQERAEAAYKTIREYPELIDYYIRLREDAGDEAVAVSKDKVRDTDQIFVKQLQQLLHDLQQRTDFYQRSWSSYDEALKRVQAFKHYVEHQDGYRLINRGGRPFSSEEEVQLYFGVMWFGSAFDTNREPNNGRGPVDFKISFGSKDKSLIEFKLASNTQLRRNLEKQVEIYEKANKTKKSLKVIICYTKADEVKVARVLKELEIQDKEYVVVIDARSDNKPPASKA